MTLELAPSGTAATDLDGFVEAIAASGYDPRCEASLAAMAPHLAALSRNRSFLGDRLLAELKSRARGQERDNGYGPQVILLHRGPGWFVRANIWPDARDALLRASGPQAFFYGIPHNHNFAFLTVGHVGPGYWSDYYAFDPRPLAFNAAADLRFVERSRLSEGRVLLYRAHVDVHAQDLPDELSVSLNLVQGTPGLGFHDQYRFDCEADIVTAQLAQSSSELLLALAPALAGDDGLDLAAHFARHHPSPRLRARAAALVVAE